jgi:hypothetical protein
MTAIVYPTIMAKKTRISAKQQEAFARDRPILHSPFVDGAMVMIENDDEKSKARQRYIGPMLIKRRNAGGAYIVVGPDGTEYKRAPHQLKKTGPIEIDTSKHAKVFKILDNRESNGSQEYYVQWYKLPDAFNSWVKEDNFDDTEIIRKYWNKKRPVENFDDTTVIRKNKKKLIKQAGKTHKLKLTLKPRVIS